MTILWRHILLVAAGSGLISGSLLLWLGLMHNTQAEFNTPDGGIDYGYCVKLFASSALVGALFGAIVFVTYKWLRHILGKGSGDV